MIDKIKKKIRHIQIMFENTPYHYGVFKRSLMSKIRYGYGWCASKFINPNRVVDIIHIPKWKLKLFRCVTPDDIYLITGIYHALLKPNICKGYSNFGITDKTYKDIADTLIENYRWNEQTRYGRSASSKIAFTWMNYSPISIQGIPDNHIMWSVYDIRQLCTKQEKGGWKFGS